jgi:hypothetical protein
MIASDLPAAHHVPSVAEWCYDGAIMVVRTQVTLDSDAHRRAKRRASDLGISFAEYIRQVVDRDLGEQPKTDISAIFGLFESDRSDISSNVDKHLGESLWKEHLRNTGQSDRDR